MTFSKWLNKCLEDNYCTPDMPDVMADEDHYLFVYGDMKHMQSHHYYVEDENYVGKAYTKFATYGILNYTGKKTPTPIAYNIGLEALPAFLYGELYCVGSEKLTQIDFLESNGILVKRERIHVVTGTNHKQCLAWTYLMHPKALSNASEMFKYVPYKKRSSFLWNTPVIDWAP
jgi:gamma-glutamylcyclotransferase (GGCT)/AIG2-like uncharacterized protein YtfP